MPRMPNSVSVMSAPEKRLAAAAEGGDEGDKGVAEGVLVDDGLLRHALRAGGTDIVGIEHFQHIGTGVAHETAYADYGNGNRGQDKMLGHIQEFSEVREILIISSLHTRKLKPAELDGEDVFQYRCEEEGRHRDTYHLKRPW